MNCVTIDIDSHISYDSIQHESELSLLPTTTAGY